MKSKPRLFSGSRLRWHLIIPTVLFLAPGRIVWAASAPTATTGVADNITRTGAILHGTVDPNGIPTYAGFRWARLGGPTNTTTPVNIGSGTLPVSIQATLTGLSPATVYRYVAVATNRYGEAGGTIRTFTTLDDPEPWLGFSFTRLAVTNYTGFVIDSDALAGNPVYNRDAIRGWCSLYVTNNTATQRTMSGFVRFSLLDQADQAIPLNTPSGTQGYLDLDWPGQSLNGYQTTNLDCFPALKPAVRLNPYVLHRVRAQCFYKPGWDTGLQTNTAPRYFLHFTNMVSSDAALNVIAWLNNAQTTRAYMVRTVPGKDTFQVGATFRAYRYDNFNDAANPIDSFPVTLEYQLFDSVGNPIALQANSYTMTLNCSSYMQGNPRSVSVFVGQPTLQVIPTAPLDSVNQTYYLQVSISHVDTPGQPPVPGNTQATPSGRWLWFNGHLRFDNRLIDTIFTSIANVPVGTIGPGYISTTLAVNNNSGYLVAKPGYTYGDGTSIPVLLYSDGYADLASGTVNLNLPNPATNTLNHIAYRHETVTLGVSNATGGVTVMLPTGFGVSTNSDGRRRLQESSLPMGIMSLNQNLDPTGTAAFALPATVLYAGEEAKPVWFRCQNVTWEPALGQLTLGPTDQVTAEHVRAAEYATLAANAPAGQDFKRANDAYFRFLRSGTQSLTGPVRVSADSNGMARMSLALNYGSGQFRAHFPYDASLAWGGVGQMVITNDLVATVAESQLSGCSNITLSYSASCSSGCYTGGISNPLVMSLEQDRLFFTRDGGLIGPGKGPAYLRWGHFHTDADHYAQEVTNLLWCTFHMPGGFLRGDQNPAEPEQGPATILLTGVVANDRGITERPCEPAYTNNSFYASYGGISYSAAEDLSCQGLSYLAGVPSGYYPVTTNSRYYARCAGVTGLHVARTFPPEMFLLGYRCGFDRYALSYLDSLNLDSRTSGYINVPWPSRFDLLYRELTFTCPGGLSNAVPAPRGNGFMQLGYWQADFEPLTISFASANQCDPRDGHLLVGVRAYASQVGEPLTGFLGFQTNGDLMSREYSTQHGLTDIDSRLALPNTLSVKGPPGQTYTLTPVANAYFNCWTPTNNQPERGFLSLVGKLDVPFFEAMKVHLHTGAHTSGLASESSYWVMGGWPNAGATNSNTGWGNFFEATYYDETNDGFPRSTNVETYRDDPTDQYHPRAQRLWLGVVGWDYPLKWSPVNRTFKSLHPVTDDLLVIRLSHELTYLDSQSASLDLGVRYAGLPKFSLANMRFNSVSNEVGVASAIIEATTNPHFDGNTNPAAYSAIMNGNTNLDVVLSPTLDGLMEPVLQDALGSTVDKLYTNLLATYTGLAPAQRLQFPAYARTNLTNDLIGQAGARLAALPDNGLCAGLSNRLDYVIRAIEAFTDTRNGILYRDSDGGRPLSKSLAHELVVQMAPEYRTSVQGIELSYRMEIAGPSLDQIGAFLDTTKRGFALVCSNLAPGGAFAEKLRRDFSSASSTGISAAVDLAAGDIAGFFDGVDYSSSNPFVDYSAEELKKLIHGRIRDRFLGTELASGMQSTIKQAVYDLGNDYRDGIDNVFQQINEVIRALVSETLAETDNALLPFLGPLADYIMSGQQSGHALIVGDSLNTLRLDSRWEWQLYKRKIPGLGIEIGLGQHWNFANHMLFRELHSETLSGCSSWGIDGVEVVAEADGVPVWFWPGMFADLSSKLSFFQDDWKILPRGIIGGLNLHGSLDSQKGFKCGPVQVDQFRGTLAIGADENYMSGAADITVNGINLFGGMFVGRTCTDLDPIEAFAPDVASLLGPPPFTGLFSYGEGWIPVYGKSCLFRVSAGVGLGIFYSAEGTTYGGKMRLGVRGEALCAVDVSGVADLIGVQQDGNFSFLGTGRVYGKVGIGRFSKEFDKDVFFRYQNDSWSVDY